MDVVGIGAVTWDRFLVVPRYPEINEKVRALQGLECAGGMVATALVALRRWGLQCRFLGVIGHDNYSDRIVEDLTAEDIDISPVLRRSDADGRRTTVLVDNRTGDRTIISGPHRVPPIEPGDIPADFFEGARVLHLDTSVDECGVEAAERARALGLKVTLDAERLGARTTELMRLCDYVIAPLYFAKECTGQEILSRAAYALHLQCERPVLVTDGRRGVEYVSGDLSFHQPVYPVPVVDSTGAGDVFHAAFIYGMLTAWDIRRVVRFASWAAACSCRELGARKGIPSTQDVRKFTKNDLRE